MQQLHLFGLKDEKAVEKKQEEFVVKITNEEISNEQAEEFAFIKKEKKIQNEEKAISQKKTAKEKTADNKSKRGRKSFKEMDTEVDLINVPEDEILFQKQYYTIGEVAGWFNVNPSLLRFWENEFDILKLRKTKKRDRLFRPEDVKNIELIYHLLRYRKFSLEGARKYLEAHKQHAETNKILIQSLTKLRSFLAELKTNLEE